MAEKIPVSGFLFNTAEEIGAAKKEAKAVVYLEERLKGRSPAEAKTMYDQILGQSLFHTAVGYTFLKELQDTLKKNGVKDIAPIPVVSMVVKKEPVPQPDAGSAPNPRLEKKLKNVRGQLRTMRAVAIVCMLMVVAMFAITLTSKSPTILNYESKVLDKYATWEQELSQREQAVSAREAELGIQSEPQAEQSTTLQPDATVNQNGAVQPDITVNQDGTTQPDTTVNQDGATQPDTTVNQNGAVQPDTGEAFEEYDEIITDDVIEQ